MAATTDYDPDTKGASFLTDTDRLFFLMEEVTRRLRRTVDSSVEQFGLTRTQWRALAYLFRSPGMTQTELARELELERASIGRTIDRLEELELVERRSAKNDRRVWRVHLRPAAIELLPKMRVEADAVHARLLGGDPFWGNWNAYADRWPRCMTIWAASHNHSKSSPRPAFAPHVALQGGLMLR